MKRIIFLSLVFFAVVKSEAQGLQPGECGIMFTYDAAGNLTQRELICNNSGVVLYKASKGETSKHDAILTSSNRNNETAKRMIKVSAIMPNPTTGKFIIRLSRAIENADVTLLDVNGKVVENRKQSGNMLSFNIGAQPSGIYFVRVAAEANVITFKVIKQ